MHMVHYFLELPENVSEKTCLSYEFTLSSWDDFIGIEVKSDAKSDPFAKEFVKGNLENPIIFYLNGCEIGRIAMTKKGMKRRDLGFYYLRKALEEERGIQKISFSLDGPQLLFLKENLIKITCHKNGGGVDATSQVLFIPIHFREKIRPQVVKNQVIERDEK